MRDQQQKQRRFFLLVILATLTQKKQWKYTNLNLDMTFLNVQSVSFRRLFNFICEVLYHEQ